MDYLFAGSDKTAASVLDSLAATKLPVVVLTREDAPVGRKKIITQTLVADIAQKHGVKLIKANQPSQALPEILSSGAERGIIVSYGSILKDEVLTSIDWFNLHFSLLPKYRGAAPVQRAIMDGNTDSGITIFKLDEGMDTGEVYQQIKADISGMNTKQALDTLAELSVEPLLDLLADETPSLSPQSGEPSMAKKLSREECFLDFNKDSKTCLRVVRASNPEPIAWTYLQGEPLRIIEAATTGIANPDSDEVNGKVTKIGKRIYVSCSDSTSLELITVQPFAKKQMSATDWFNGVGEVILGN